MNLTRRYNALAALGFKCSQCGAIKDLHILHKQGKHAAKSLARMIDVEACIASNYEIRAQYFLACSSCRANHDKASSASMVRQASEKKQASKLDLASSEQARISTE